jgi:hypothetical protein
MTAIQKWKLNVFLNPAEINEIIFELFQGFDKKFVYSPKEKINMDLYEIFTSFKNEKSIKKINFSMDVCEKPFISLKEFNYVNFVLKGENFNVYIYE